MKIILTAVVLLFAHLATAQAPTGDLHSEIEVWSGGGHSVPGGTSHTGVWNLGVRHGWVLTNPHGPGFLSGQFEYAVDVVPAYAIFQPANTAFGAGINPFNVKWLFTPHGHVAPYIELGGGVLFTNHNVPTRTSAINFTPGAAMGVHFLGGKLAWTAELRYQHISNAGLAYYNPGINTLQLRLGIGKFSRR